MKIIELLNMIVKGEEVPKKIKYAGIIWEYDNTTKDYIADDMFLIYRMNSFALNKSFEIIEEDKKIEKLKENESIETDTGTCLRNITNKINEIIDYLMENKQ